MKDKIDKLMELLEEISDIYPDMDKAIVNNTTNPDYIILATTDYLNKMAKSFGISDEFEEVVTGGDFSEIYPDIPKKKKYKGPIQ